MLPKSIGLSCAGVALILALAVPARDAILTGAANDTSPLAGGNSGQAPEPEPKQQQAKSDLDANATFYYEANAFLLNANASATKEDDSNLLEAKQSASANNGPSTSTTKLSSSLADSPKTKDTVARVRPAATSARSGRAMDLDALVGDVAASRANKERSATISGNRQSRFMPGLDVGPGKKLHIQGFIPIMSVKDATASDTDPDDAHSSTVDQSNGYSGYLTSGAKMHKPRAQTLASLSASNELNLPYAQSSIGHASYGIHRYLNGAESQPQPQPQAPFFDSSHSADQTKAASGAAAVVDTIRRPIKKLAELASGGNQYSSLISRPHQQQQHQQQQVGGGQCLCVPFYMCKNGFISESGLGRPQVQQLIAQQQQQQQQVMLMQQQPYKLSPYDQIEMKSSPTAQSQQLPATSQSSSVGQQGQAQFADSYVPVDERSFDRELITMSTLANFNESTNTNSNSSDPQPLALGDFGSVESSQLTPQQPSSDQTQAVNLTDPNSEYSQEILGRMLGLKTGFNQRQSSHLLGSLGSSPLSSSSSNGVCGLLRTCCQIPYSFNSQQDLIMGNEKLLAQFNAQQQQQQVYQPPTQLQRVSSPVNSQLQRQFNQQQVPTIIGGASSMHQSKAMLAQQQPYGFPATQVSLRPQLMQPGLSTMADGSSMLAHRTNQFPMPQASNRYSTSIGSPQQAGQMVSQYTRSAAMSPPQIQSFAQQTQPALTRSLPSAQSFTQAPLAGTRKILDGRCGLRQAMGVTGRVQNLQYHDSSAEFGEYPAQAAILKRLPGADSLFVCGGTLISQYWVATAAHCIKKHLHQNGNELKVRLGEWDVHRDDEFYPFVEKDVRDIVIHPEFVSGNLANDLALLRLDSPVDPSLPHVNPACLPTIDESFTRQQCWVTGWGKDSFGQRGSFQSVLREVELPVIGHGECESALRQTRLGPHYRLNQGFICAGGEGGKDACEGDGGSGLYCAQDGVVKVAGLVSWGIGCGQAGVPGVYVNMAHYRPWIESIISIDEDIYSPYANMIGSNSPISERSNSNATGISLSGSSSDDEQALVGAAAAAAAAATTTTQAPGRTK